MKTYYQMKKTAFLLMAVMTVVMAAARPVDAVKARRVAEVYLQAQGMRNTDALVDVTKETSFTELYVFAAPKGGFILVSGDDCVLPVLGYSAGNNFDTKDIPEQLKEWLGNCENEMRYWRAREASGEWQVPEEISSQWALLAGGRMPAAKNTKSMCDTLTVTWSQGLYYNLLCPVDTNHSSGHTPTGCVATAMGMVMKYWNFPTTGYLDHSYTPSNSSYGVQYADFGSTTYQWDSMPDKLTAYTSGAQDTAVALLLYHAGVSVNMGYGPSGSGAQSNAFGNINKACQENALTGYFKYKPSLHCLHIDDYSMSEWNAIMTAEIDAGRPVLYAGTDTSSGGHAYVLDGYNTDGYFHINWGWNGGANGYYPIGGLNPSGRTLEFNTNNRANIGVEPNYEWGTNGTITIVANDSTMGSVTPTVNYSFGDTVELSAFPNEGYRFSGWSDGYMYNPRTIFATGGNYEFTANFEPVTGDTLHYLHGNHRLSTVRAAGGNTTWGIMLPESLLNPASTLVAVQLYVASTAEHTLTIYTGSSHDIVLATKTVTFTNEELDQWQTITLDEPVDASHDLWIVFHCVDAEDYPLSYTYGSGVPESYLWGTSLSANGISKGRTAMIKAIFSSDAVAMPYAYITAPKYSEVNTDITFTAYASSNATLSWEFADGTPATATGDTVTCRWTETGLQTAILHASNSRGTFSDTAFVNVVDYINGDTISYPIDRSLVQNYGYTNDTTHWGIMIPTNYLEDRDTLKEVLLNVISAGSYNLRIYQGGDTVPEVLVYSQYYTIDTVEEMAYIPFIPDSSVVIDKDKNLWIVFFSDAPYPATACEYTGNVNSDWYSDGEEWAHMGSFGSQYRITWMIKAVTAKTVHHEGVEDAPVADHLRVYPNPAIDRLNIVVAEPGQLLIVDAMGRTVHTQTVSNPGEQTINVSNLLNGVYYIKMGNRITSFVVKH